MNIAKVLIGRLCPVLPLLGMGFAVKAASAQSFVTLYSFNGSSPVSSLVQAANGDLYGTTSSSSYTCLSVACGTIFKVSPSGTFTTVYSFCMESGCPDGALPNAGLVQATNGELYGTTSQGGAYGGGTAFKLTLSGNLTTLYSFCSQSGCVDGEDSSSPLIQAGNGDFYGTTFRGGVGGEGTVFKITPSGNLTTLYSFCSQIQNGVCTDGSNPSGLVQATNGELYGTTDLGGLANCSPEGCGTIFKITPSGTFTTLYSFCSQPQGFACLDGNTPYAGLVQATNGELYGTTNRGGANGTGTVFKVTATGALTTLYSFCAYTGCPEGSYPMAGLLQAPDGDLYGTAYDTIFKITLSGVLTTLYTFCLQADCPDGDGPAGLVQYTNGSLYGTTLAGGANNYGTAFRLSVGLNAFVETRPTIGVVGEIVAIIGYGLKDATSVTFNGTPATILYDAPTVIYAKVPTGATTGKVQVVTPKGTLTSNVAFEVAP
jgi:uncharacterized repeat protein (TIGR03803 family)